MFKFNYKSFIISIVFLIILIFIALFVKDSFVRPFLGDSLAVIWLFFTFNSFINISLFWLSIISLIISYCVELAQYFDILSFLGLNNIRVLKIIFGSTFDLSDILAYTFGWIIILVIIRIYPNRI